MDGEPTGEHWYQPIADFLGEAYLRNEFTLGTGREVDFLLPRLFPGGDVVGRRVLDAGCGPGRHALELARRGCLVTGVDISPRFVELAREKAAAESLPVEIRHGDVLRLQDVAAFDAVVCLCQGGFGLTGGDPGDDIAILRNLAAALVPGGRLALSAFHAFFAASGVWEDADFEFDPATGQSEEIAVLRNMEGAVRRVRASTTCYTARELRLLARVCDLEVLGLWGVTPGAYREAPPTAQDPELLLLARRP